MRKMLGKIAVSAAMFVACAAASPARAVFAQHSDCEDSVQSSEPCPLLKASAIAFPRWA